MCYLIISKEENKIKIMNYEELIKKNEEILILNEFIVNELFFNHNFEIIDLKNIIENESSDWLSFYEKKTWENIFWLFGYDIADRAEEISGKDIFENKDEVFLFYLQNIIVLNENFKKGEKFKRFIDMINYYEKNILDKEKNKLFKSIMKKNKEEWLII